MQLTTKGTVGKPSFYTWGSVQPDMNQPTGNLIKNHLVAPMFQNVQLFDGSTEITPDNVVSAIEDLWLNNKVDPTLDQELRDIYNHLTPYTLSDENIIDDILGVQALYLAQLPHPSTNKKRMVTYTVQDDIIPSAFNLQSRWTNGAKDLFFASLYGYIRTRNFENILFIGVKNLQAWQSYTTKVTTLAQTTNSIELNTKAQQLAVLPFDTELSQTVLLNESLANDSFEHILLQALHEEEPSGDILPLPINAKSQIMPSVITFFNIERLANATPVEVTDDLNTINTATRYNMNMKMVKSNRLRTAQTIMPSSAPSQSSHKGGQLVRRKLSKINGKPLNMQQQLKRIIKIVNNRMSAQQSFNTYKTEKKTFMRANRRDPFNLNLQGKTTKTQYRPDIHIFVDTSGSISEQNHRASVLNLIMIAKKLDVDIYVSSWSHVISKPSRLHIKGKSVAQIYQEYLAIPKVGGGTDFEQFWDQINMIDQLCQKSNKSYRLSFVITDFEANIPRSRTFTNTEAAVRNTFYIPIATKNYAYVVSSAKKFVKGMAQKGIDVFDHMIM